MSKETLRPCPFCGDKKVSMTDGFYRVVYVSCNQCAAHGPSKISVADASEAWNRVSEAAAMADINSDERMEV